MNNFNEILTKINSLKGEREELISKNDEISSKLGTAENYEEDSNNLLQLRDNLAKIKSISDQEIELYQMRNRIIYEVNNINREINNREESIKKLDNKIKEFSSFPETLKAFYEIQNDELEMINQLKKRKDSYFNEQPKEEIENKFTNIEEHEIKEERAEKEEKTIQIEDFADEKFQMDKDVFEENFNDFCDIEPETDEKQVLVNNEKKTDLDNQNVDYIDIEPEMDEKITEQGKQAVVTEENSDVVETKQETPEQKVKFMEHLKNSLPKIKKIGTVVAGIAIVAGAGVLMATILGTTSIPLLAIGAGSYVAGKSGVVKIGK